MPSKLNELYDHLVDAADSLEKANKIARETDSHYAIINLMSWDLTSLREVIAKEMHQDTQSEVNCT